MKKIKKLIGAFAIIAIMGFSAPKAAVQVKADGTVNILKPGKIYQVLDSDELEELDSAGLKVTEAESNNKKPIAILFRLPYIDEAEQLDIINIMNGISIRIGEQEKSFDIDNNIAIAGSSIDVKFKFNASLLDKENTGFYIELDTPLTYSLSLEVYLEVTPVNWLVDNVLKNAGVTIFLSSVGLGVLFRAILKVYNLGRMDKKGLVTKEEQHLFEESVRTDMRSWKEELTTVVLNTSDRVINEKLKDVESARELIQEFKVDKAKLALEINEFSKSRSHIDDLTNQVRVLNTKITRLEFGNNDDIPGNQRRTK